MRVTVSDLKEVASIQAHSQQSRSEQLSSISEADITQPRTNNVDLEEKDHRSKLRLAFLCSGDPENVLTWSGTPHHMLQALRSEFDVALVLRKPWPAWAQFVRRAGRRLTKGHIDLSWWPAWARITAAQSISRLISSHCDVVFSVAATPICAEVVTQVPTVFVSDATLECMVNYNPRFSSLAPFLKQAGKSLEDKCIQNSVMSLFPSEWAARSAIVDHGGQPERVVQIPWGANMQAVQIIPPESRSSVEWRLLFVGTNWDGKGGDIALETIRDMRSQGHNVHLDVVGSTPAMPTAHDGVTFHGFLDKRDPSSSTRIEALFSAAHVFFLPTRFEALGIVFAEAASYALPAVSYATGGVPAMVRHETTGLLLEEGASPASFAQALIDLLSDRPRYVAMSHAALETSREHLNWTAWAKRVRKELEARLPVRSSDTVA